MEHSRFVPYGTMENVLPLSGTNNIHISLCAYTLKDTKIGGRFRLPNFESFTPNGQDSQPNHLYGNPIWALMIGLSDLCSSNPIGLRITCTTHP